MIKKHFKIVLFLLFLLFVVQFSEAQVPPIANDNYDTAEINTTLNVTSPGVLENDTAADAAIINVTEFLINGITYIAGQTAVFAEGSLNISADGSYIFIPSLNYTGNVSVITYTISDGTFTSFADLLLTVEHIDNLLEISSFESCNQGYTSNGEYKVIYTVFLKNLSTARDYHTSSLIKNIDLTTNLQTTFGNGCVVEVDGVEIYNNNYTLDYINNTGYPREFTVSATNSNFLNVTSSSIFNNDAINDLILYPRQDVTVIFCVTVNPLCNGRPNPTPSGSGIDFNNTINVTSDRGNDTDEVFLTDFHTTEAVVTAGFYVPEFDDSLSPDGTINSDGTYDYINTVIITNEGTSTANNINYNMGLGNFLDNGITFDQLIVSQVSGPDVLINTNYNGDTDTFLLLPNNSLASGQKVVLEIFYLIQPINSTRYSYFYQNKKSQTQGALDGFDETEPSIKRNYSFVIWSDSLGNHLDRYYEASSPTQSVSSSLQCSCTTASMRFLFTSSSSNNKIISEVNDAPNNILEHEEITFQITIKNTSESVQLGNLQLQDNLTSICGGNIVSFSTPFIQNSTATIDPTLNINFNGTSDINLFDGSSGILKADEIVTIQFSVVYIESCIGFNTSSFSATNPLNSAVNSSASVSVDASTDTDNDGVPNNNDIDDDNDTILDTLEYNGLNPLEDHDTDFIPNYRDIDFGADANGDGIVDIFDFDGDGVPNHFDLDSDNDGILDIVEAGNITADSSNNGRTNNTVGANGLDNTLENNDTTGATIIYTIPNTDLNGAPNYLDIDADGDGIVDNIEAQSTNSYIPTNGTVSTAGIDTAYPNGITPIDTENDTIYDYIDTNSDDDIRDDVIEGWDINSDGIAETLPSNLDADNDGLDDAFDTNNNAVNPTNGQVPTDFPNADDTDTAERDWREIIAIFVIIESISATEGEDLEFTISLVTKNDTTLLIESASTIDINFSTTNGTEITSVYDVATSPFDYNGITNTTFTIPPFSDTAKFKITSLEDIIFELDELFTLIGVISSNNTLNTEIKGIGTIIDNDAAPSITMNNSREDEGIDLVHTIIISHPCSAPILIDMNTSDNLAISPDDYIAISESLTIEGTVDPNNANTQVSFSIVSILDNLNELDEEILNVIGAVTTTNIGMQDLIKTATIIDVDPNPFVDIENVKAEEGNFLVFNVRLLNANLEPMQNYIPINFILETIDDTTNANEDYQSIVIFTNIPAYTYSIIQSVKTIDDRLNEDTEELLLQATTNLSNVSNSFLPSGIGFIIDNDYPNLFSPNSDGKSDVFKISGIEDYPNFKLIIYNRLGNEVYNYSNNGITNPIWWNGEFNGKPAPVGVYYYTLDFNDGSTKPRTNFIQLIR
jgi:gliding motility-associated-like protein